MQIFLLRSLLSLLKGGGIWREYLYTSGPWLAQVCVLLSAGTQHSLELLVLLALRSNALCVGLGCVQLNFFKHQCTPADAYIPFW